MQGWIETRTTAAGPRWDACWRAGSKKKSRTFGRRKDAEKFLSAVVVHVHAGGYVDVKPALMDKLFDGWLLDLDTRVKEGSMKQSAARSYRSMLENHLRPAFGHFRSDRLTLAEIEAWRSGVAAKIAAGTMAPKYLQNQRNLLHVIIEWARHPARAFLAHDPLAGLPKLRLSRARRRPSFEPDQVRAILAIAASTPPDDTILKVAAYSGLRRGELFALQWSDLDGGQLHVRRRLYQGVLDTPKTDAGSRVVDIPQALIDELAIYRLSYPPIGETETAFVFRTATGTPIDPDNWHRRRFVPILRQAGLHAPGAGLHALRHGYVSLLAHQGADVRQIADQVGHSSVQLTNDVYRHTLQQARTGLMRALDEAISSGRNPANLAGTGETSTNEEESKAN